ncbi:MAG: GntR family transcriptional regulator [Planctomycetota bacterium]|nr:GntR family transcriptional regulator [Planctomycetota bacterium]
MLITIDRHNGVPAYRQVVEQIRFGVASGLLAPGDELPSTRGLSAEVGTNPMTISKAYGLLEREGLLVRRPGLPLVVAPLAFAPGTAPGAEPSPTDRREAELRRALEAPASMARRLGIDRARAAELLGEVIDETPQPPEDDA